MKNFIGLLLACGLLSISAISNAQNRYDEQYANYSQTIFQQGPNQMLDVRRLLNLSRDMQLNNLVLVAASSDNYNNTLSVYADNQLLLQTNVSNLAYSFNVQVNRTIGYQMRNLTIVTSGNIKIYHVGVGYYMGNYPPPNPPPPGPGPGPGPRPPGPGPGPGPQPPPPPPPQQPQTITVNCSSSGYAYTECPINGQVVSVALTRQISRSACDYGNGYGIASSQRAIYADKGCRGEFRVEYWP